jgi:hypothetical protein
MVAKLFTLVAVPGGGVIARSADSDDDITALGAAVAKAWSPLLQFCPELGLANPTVVAWKPDMSLGAPVMFALFDAFRLENAGRALACGDTMALGPKADFATSDGAAELLAIPNIVTRAAKPSVIWVFIELLSVLSPDI